MRIIGIIIIIAAGLAAYANCLDNRFIPDWDDKWLVIDNSYIKEISAKNVLNIINPAIDRSVLGSEYLPVRDFSYMLDYRLYRLKPFGYHLTNVILHIAASILLFLILNRYIPDLRASLLGAVIFAVHPVHTESVSWIASRKDVLALFFCMASLWLYIKHEYASTGSSCILLILSVCSYILAVLSKAIAVTFPFLILLFAILFDRKGKTAIRKAIPYFAAMIPLLALGIYTARTSGVMKHEYYGGSLPATVYSMSNVLIEYVKLLFLPVNLEIPRHTAQYLHTSLMDAKVLLSLTCLSALFAASTYWLIRIYRNNMPDSPVQWLKKGIAFSALWFLAAIAPVSNILPGQELIAERYLYLPSVGFSVLIACALVWLLSIPSIQKNFIKGIIVISAIAIAVSFTILTIVRNNDWQDSYSLWTATIRHNPQNAVAIAKLGAFYMYQAEKGDDVPREEAKELERLAVNEYERALQTDPSLTSPRNDLGIYYTNLHDWPKAEEHLLTAIHYDPDYAPAWANLSSLYYRMYRNEDAFRAAQKSVELAPKKVEYRINIANYYLRKAEEDEKSRTEFLDMAEDELLYMLTLNNLDIDAHITLGRLYELKGKQEEAIEQFSAAVRLNEVNPETHSHLGMLFAAKADRGEIKFTKLAIEELEKAVQYDPLNPEHYNNLGAVYLELTRSYGKAAEMFFTAMKYAPDYTTAKTNYARALTKLKKYNEAFLYLNEVLKTNPSDYYAGKALAFFYFDAGKYEYSKQICLDLLRRVPYDYEVLIELGHIYHRLNDNGNALVYYEEARKHAPYPKILNEIEGYVKELNK